MNIQKMAVPIAISVMMVAVIFTVALTPAMAADPSDVCKDSIRLYGTFGEGAGDQSIACENKPYTDPEGPFFPQHPQAPMKDFMTFNPAIMDHNDGYPELLFHECCTNDVETGKEKVFKRMWYEKEWFKDKTENGVWDVVIQTPSGLEVRTLDVWNAKPEWEKVCDGESIVEWNNPEGKTGEDGADMANADIYAPAIVQEFTYLFTDTDTMPMMIAEDSKVLIPMAHDPSDPVGQYRGLNSFDADLDGVRDALTVESEFTLNLDIDGDGTIENMNPNGIPLDGDESVVLTLTKSMDEGTSIQYFDTIVELDTVSEIGNVGHAIFTIKDNEGGESQRVTTPVTLAVGNVATFHRAVPGTPQATATFYLKVVTADADDNYAIVEVGRMFGQAHANIGISPDWNQKAFMVDEVFYSVAAVMTNSDDCIKYITIRQKLPKFPIKLYGKHLEVWDIGEMLPEPAPFCEDHMVLEDVLPVQQPLFCNPHDQQDKIGEPVARPPLNITYDEEDIEPRFTGSLLEILDEPPKLGPDCMVNSVEHMDEQWMVEWFHTYPHQYTNFILPPEVRVLVTLSWIAPEAETTIWDGSTTPIADYTGDRVKFWYEDCTGPLYIDDETGSIRVYGTFGEGAGDQSIACENKPYTDPEAPFFPQHPQAPVKDFMTFNPAIMDHNDGYPELIFHECCTNDVETGKEKVFKRMWYEKEWFKDKTENGVWDVVIQTPSGLEVRTLDVWNAKPEWEKVCDGESIVEWNNPEGKTGEDGADMANADIYAPAIVQEFTYLFTDTDTMPMMIAEDSKVLIPMAHDPSDPVGQYRGLNSFDADLDGVRDALTVESEFTLNLDIDGDGTNENMNPNGIPLDGDESVVLTLTKFMDEGTSIQYFDTIVELDTVSEIGNVGHAIFTIKDNEGGESQRVTTPVSIAVGNVATFHRAMPGTPQATATFYLKVVTADAVDNYAVVEVGRMFGQAHANIGISPDWNQKAFMVDEVFYSVAAVMTNSDDCIKYITIRQKLPKFPIKLYGKHLEVWDIGEMLPEPAPFCEGHTVLVDVLPVQQPLFCSPHDQQDKIGEKVARPPLNITYDEEAIEERFTGSLLEILDEPECLGPNFMMYLAGFTVEQGMDEQWMVEWFHTYPHQYTSFVLPEGELYLMTLAWYAPEAETTIWDGSDTPIVTRSGDRAKFWYDPADPTDIYVTKTAGTGPVSPECKGDLDDDGDIDSDDFMDFADAYNTASGDPNYDPAGDFDDDGDIDSDDFMDFAEVYNTQCPP